MHGVIAAGHPQTAEAGAEILKMGGNAVDAAVAAAFASFVAESALVNIGGGGIAQIFNPATGQATVYDFFSTMPGLSDNGSAARPSGQMDFKKVLVDFGAAVQPFYIGRGSVAVPGVVAGLCQMLADAGTLPLATVLQPAINEARNGVLVTEAQRYIIHLLTPILTNTPGIAAIYAPNGQIVQAGSTLCFPNLAETLEQLGQEGASLFYTGRVAQQILHDQRQFGGLLTAEDLQAYRVFSCRPIPVQYRDYTILLPPPSSSGGVLIAFALKLLAGVSLAGLVHNGFEHLRLLTEVMRLTSAARAGWEDDLDTTDNPAALAAAFLSDKNLAGYRQKLRAVLAGELPQAEAYAKKGPSNTTHLSVADANGMLAAVTTSAGECSGFVVEGTGVKLNNMLGEIDLHRNGFHQLPPGRRLMTMMSPALVLRHGQPVLAVGSGGSNRLRSAILQVLSNVIDFELPLHAAVEASRLHFEDNEVQLEGGISTQTAERMAVAGYAVNLWPDRNMFFGGAHTVAREGNRWEAAGDPRRGGSTLVI